MTKPQTINIIIYAILILTLGLISGYALGYYRASVNSFPEIKLTEEVNPEITTIKLMEVKNGMLKGEIAGDDIRIAYSADRISDFAPGDSFEIPLNSINLKSYYKTESIPDWAMYAASKSGKYYYSVFDKRAYNLSQTNIIYFKNAADAEKMGYAKK